MCQDPTLRAVAAVSIAFLLLPAAAGSTDAGATKGADAALSCDAVLTASIDPATDHDFFSFSAGAGEIVTVTVVADPDRATITTFWRLLIDGMPASSCGTSTISDQEDCGPFAEAPATVVLEVEDFFNDAIGPYAVHLQRLPSEIACDQVPLTEDVAVDATIEHFVDNDLFSFCVSDTAIVRIKAVADPAEPTISTFWRVLDGEGVPAEDCGSFNIGDQDDCGPLSATGNPYRIQVQDFFNDATGDYTVIVFALAGELVACPPSPFIFADGFESGDVSRWSSASP